MKEEILNSLHNPAHLEKLYRENKKIFQNSFNAIYENIKENCTAQVWHERLNFSHEEISWGSKKELTFVIIASFIAGLIAKIPDFTGISPDYFFPRNVAFVFLPLLTAYFAWKQNLPSKNIVVAASAFLFSAVYINLFPDDKNSDTMMLSFIHLPLFLWSVLGITFSGFNIRNNEKRIDFLRFNGEMIVMTGITLAAGGLMTAITINLFGLIGLQIEDYYFKYFGIWGLAAVPIIATYLVQVNPQLVNKVSPVIAKVFTPLVLVMLIIYLVAVIYTGKDPYNDREFLLIFNVLLIGVMAIILFSIAGTSKSHGSRISDMMLLALSIVTIIVNGIALSAIVFRIAEWGITPNRLAVLGGNILILTNLLIVSYRLFQSVKDRNEIKEVERSIASFLPVYICWTIVVTFIFPLIFNFR